MVSKPSIQDPGTTGPAAFGGAVLTDLGGPFVHTPLFIDDGNTGQRPKACPIQMEGAILVDTYAINEDGVNHLYPTSGTSCVTQPVAINTRDSAGNPIKNASTYALVLPPRLGILEQVCDYAPSVSERECNDLVNMTAHSTVIGSGSSAITLPAAPRPYMNVGHHWCQRYSNGIADYYHPLKLSLGIKTLNKLPNLVEIKSGSDFSCGLDSSGDLYCWGANVSGQLGLGVVNPASPHANKVIMPDSHTKVIEFAVASQNVCVIAEDPASSSGPDRAIHCWGANDKSQVA